MLIVYLGKVHQSCAMHVIVANESHKRKTCLIPLVERDPPKLLYCRKIITSIFLL